MPISPVTWQALTIQPTFEPLLQAVHFFDFQPKAKQALSQLQGQPFGQCLILKSELYPAILTEIEQQLVRQDEKVLSYMEFDARQLFGYELYLKKENRIEHIQGAIEQANQGTLILNLDALLTDLAQWDKLKQALLFGQYQLPAANTLPRQASTATSSFNLLLIGSRSAISTLFNYDDSLYQFSQYAEIEHYVTLDEETLPQWVGYVQNLSKRYVNKPFSQTALTQLLAYLMRENESQQMISLSPIALKHHCLALERYYPQVDQFDDIQGYFNQLEEQANSLNQYVLQDMLTEQIYIETEDETVGQINGLSVVEFDGVPYPFGEPLRISCNVQYGDGEIQDIERKVELGGNIHSKGILLAQSCLANFLELPTQLPFSASLVFEQSYGEIDGDSSSLAIFCVLVSALTKLPVPQSLAITGAIDQFGNVLSVGGVTRKIEGFFDLCEARGLTGKQGVIIPQVCLSHLSLKPAVMEAIKLEQFSIWAVDDVFDAVEILFKREFFSDNPQDETIFQLIHQQLSQQENETSGSIWQKIRKLWVKA